jgi:hypothetical protein
VLVLASALEQALVEVIQQQQEQQQQVQAEYSQ